MELFTALTLQLGNEDSSTAPDIKFNKMLDGTALFLLDFTPIHSTENLQPIRMQDVRVELKFTNSLPEAIHIIAVLQQPKTFQADKNKRSSVIQ